MAKQTEQATQNSRLEYLAKIEAERPQGPLSSPFCEMFFTEANYLAGNADESDRALSYMLRTRWKEGKYPRREDLYGYLALANTLATMKISSGREEIFKKGLDGFEADKEGFLTTQKISELCWMGLVNLLVAKYEFLTDKPEKARARIIKTIKETGDRYYPGVGMDFLGDRDFWESNHREHLDIYTNAILADCFFMGGNTDRAYNLIKAIEKEELAKNKSGKIAIATAKFRKEITPKPSRE